MSLRPIPPLLFALAPLLFVSACSSASDGTPADDDAAGSDTAISGDEGGAPDAFDETSNDTGRGDAAPAESGGDAGDASAEVDAPPLSPKGLHVEGNALVDGGKTVRLLGVNHSGGEYACVNDYAILEGPTGDALTKPILSWKANTVRVPVNEQCWLGINGLDPKYAGDVYRKTIGDYVHTLRAAGLYVIFDMHWGAPSTFLPKGQLPMADADHAPEFWRSAAAYFKDDPGVLFDLFNEPFIDSGNADTTDAWACLQHGCTIKAMTVAGISYPAYKSAGMQELVDAVRSTGAKNVIMVSGLAYTNDLSKWLAHAPTDPTGNLAASLHLYNFNSCKDAGCWASDYEPVAKKVPVITGELGEDDCAPSFIDGYMSWADAHGISYLGWTWNTWDCKSGPALISDYAGTATAFGAGLRDHLRSL